MTLTIGVSYPELWGRVEGLDRLNKPFRETHAVEGVDKSGDANAVEGLCPIEEKCINMGVRAFKEVEHSADNMDGLTGGVVLAEADLCGTE